VDAGWLFGQEGEWERRRDYAAELASGDAAADAATDAAVDHPLLASPLAPLRGQRQRGWAAPWARTSFPPPAPAASLACCHCGLAGLLLGGCDRGFGRFLGFFFSRLHRLHHLIDRTLDRELAADVLQKSLVQSCVQLFRSLGLERQRAREGLDRRFLDGANSSAFSSVTFGTMVKNDVVAIGGHGDADRDGAISQQR
jgi:hypothetical protein